MTNGMHDADLHGQRAYALSMSVGVVPFDPHGGLTLEAAITRADQAMYIAKHKGRNCVAMSK